VQAPGSTSTGPTLRREDIDRTGIPWETNIFEDDEDMRSVDQAILMLNQALTISTILALTLTTCLETVFDDLIPKNSCSCR
jgi:hypothetical protein